MSIPPSEESADIREGLKEQANSKLAGLILQLAELTFSVDQATSAICANDLNKFEDSLRQQEILCAEIGSALRSIIDRDNVEPPQVVRDEVRKATSRNHKYLLLLQQVNLHAHSLLRLHHANREDGGHSRSLSAPSMKGRYV